MSKIEAGNKVMIGKLTDLPDKVGKEVIVGDQSIAVFRLASGKVRAVENKCPHKNGPLSQGIVAGEHVFCPLHDWKVCLDDGLVQKPDIGCVKTFETVIDGDAVFLLVD
ncbi:nitrite reductase small subunit NirD [Alkalihalobacterium alkalinitrilicum]|uniref:nitrite reductase small subunit NirD n=1 Tax=Alkalihalobacterium alkalinitrilicum TaxID=427920 RepID=UPI00114F6FF0|nr:nitrite reductase small subunit NirD [Alkalihalobacterium alkalinitrilicum]